MLENWPISLLIATVLGFLAGLGVGGGSLLILWLTLVLNWDISAAKSLNLLFFLPASTVTCFFRWKQGAVEFRKILPAVTAGCIAVIFGNWLGTVLHTELVKKLFGGLLIITGIREVFYKPKKPM